MSLKDYFTNNDKFVELNNTDIKVIEKSKNILTEDTRPIPKSERDWSTKNYINLWTGILVSIPVYMMASSLLSIGMTWYQAFLVCVIGHTLVLIPSILLGHFGTKYGASFPVLSKMVFGPKGTSIPTLIRAFMGCLWFGIQSWVGGVALDAIIGAILPIWNNLSVHGILSFIIFTAFNIYIGYHGSKAIKYLEDFSAPVLIILSGVVIAWALYVCGGFDGIFSTKVAGSNNSDFWKLFFPSLTAMIAFDSTIALNFSDFTRHSKTQKAQAVGQLIGAPIMTAFIVFVGICGSAGSEVAFGEAFWDPSILVSQFSNPVIVVIFSLFIILATLTTNVACNLASAGVIFSTIFSKYLSYKNSIIFVGIIGVLFMPWRLMANPNSYVYFINGTLAVLLGPITGICMATYWIQYKTKLKVSDLYIQDKGDYYYYKGWNISAISILGCTSVLIFACKYINGLLWIYDSSYLIGCILTFSLYCGVNRYMTINRKRTL